MKFLIKLALLVVILLIGYNYFLGNESEKQNSKEIVQKIEELGVSIGALIKSEKQKYDNGKYDDALENVQKLIGSIKDKVKDLDLSEKLDQIEKKKNELSKQLQTEKGEQLSEEAKTNLDEGLKDILLDLEDLIESSETF